MSQFEIFLKVPCWAVSRDRIKEGGLAWFNDEEAVANANSIRQLRALEPRTQLNRLYQSFLSSPLGYRDFSAALSDEGFRDHLMEVLRHNIGIPAVDLQTGFLDSAFDALAVFPDLDDARRHTSRAPSR